MRTTQTNKTEKRTEFFLISVPSISFLPPTRVVLTLTRFKKKGGET